MNQHDGIAACKLMIERLSGVVGSGRMLKGVVGSGMEWKQLKGVKCSVRELR